MKGEEKSLSEEVAGIIRRYIMKRKKMEWKPKFPNFASNCTIHRKQFGSGPGWGVGG